MPCIFLKRAIAFLLARELANRASSVANCSQSDCAFTIGRTREGGKEENNIIHVSLYFKLTVLYREVRFGGSSGTC